MNHTMKFYKSNSSDRLSPSASRETKSKESPPYLSSVSKTADKPPLGLQSDGTYRQRSHKMDARQKKKAGLQKTFSKLTRSVNGPKSKSSSPSSSPSRVLEAVTIQYPVIATDGLGAKGGVELDVDLSFDTAATVDISEDVDELGASVLGIVPSVSPVKGDQNGNRQSTSTSTLGRIFPKVFDDEGYIKCACGYEYPVAQNEDELSLITVNSPKKALNQSKEIAGDTATNDNAKESNDSTVNVATQHGCSPVDAEETTPTAAAADSKPKPDTSLPSLNGVNNETVTDDSVDAGTDSASYNDTLEGKAATSDNALAADEEAFKGEADHLALMEKYQYENERLKQEIERLGQLNRFKAEHDQLKDKVARLEKEMSLGRKDGPTNKVEDQKKDGLEHTQKKRGEGLATGLFVRIATMFDDGGFIKCISPK